MHYIYMSWGRPNYVFWYRTLQTKGPHTWPSTVAWRSESFVVYQCHELDVAGRHITN